MTVASTEIAMSSTAQTPSPAITRSWKTKTPARTSVTPVEVRRERGGGRRAHAHHGAGEARGAQARRRCRTTAARSRSAMARDRLGRAAVVGVARVRHHAARPRARGERPRDVDEERVTGLHAGAVAVAVDLDQRRDVRRRGAATACAASTLSTTTARSAPRCAQRAHVVELARRDADGVQDVGDAGVERTARLP